MAGRKYPIVAIASVALALVLAGCGGSSSSSSGGSGTVPAFGPSLDLGLPEAVTGTETGSPLMANYVPQDMAQPMDSSDGNCQFAGQNENDPFRNGYTMTRFLSGTAASWICFTDFLNSAVAQLVFFGVVTTDGTLLDISDGSDGPTGLSVVVAGSQKTIRLYFLGDTVNPGMYLSWIEAGAGVTGRLVVHAAEVLRDPAIDLSVDPEGPTHLRMDFDYNGTRKIASMYMAFDPDGVYSAPSWDNRWANGFRIDLVRQASDGSFGITGLITMYDQFDNNYGGSELPNLAMRAVADAAGNGGSNATMSDVGLDLIFDNPETLGEFLFTKDDNYFFTAAGLAEYINKSVTAATHHGGENFVVDSDGVDSAADVDSVLSTGTDYVDCVGGSDAECVSFLNALFTGGGFFGVEVNYGSLPSDGRPAAVSALTPPSYATPDANAGDWSGVFNMVYP